MKVSEITANVEYIKEGYSDSKSFEDWKDFYAKRHAEEDRKKAPIEANPNKGALAALQDHGLGQRLPDLPSAQIVGVPKK